MKVVLDTNILISGLAYPDSNPGRILGAWDLHALKLVMSRDQVAEVAAVLRYPKIRKLLKWDDSRIELFVRQLLLRVELVDIDGTVATVPRDAKDSPILASLVASGADVLITGDGDLLELGQQYAIESPAQFVRRL